MVAVPPGATQAELDAHAADTTNVHGITDTAALVVTTDARLTDARTPSAHAASHRTGGSDPLLPRDIGAVSARVTTGASINVPFWECDNASTQITAGVLYVQRLTLLGGRAYTTIKMLVGNTQGVTLTNTFFSLFDVTSLAKLAATTDQSTPVAAVIAGGLLTVTLNYTPAASGDVWCGLQIGSAVTAPSFMNKVVQNSTAAANAPVPFTHKHNTASLTAVPDPLVLQVSPATFRMWAVEYS